jgi:hypothetical protein
MLFGLYRFVAMELKRRPREDHADRLSFAQTVMPSSVLATRLYEATVGIVAVIQYP